MMFHSRFCSKFLKFLYNTSKTWNKLNLNQCMDTGAVTQCHCTQALTLKDKYHQFHLTVRLKDKAV